MLAARSGGVCALGVAQVVVIGRTYLPARRPAVFGWISAAWVLPSLVGGPLAGWLTTQLSWRWVFWVVVIPAAVAAALLLRRRGTLGGPGHPDLADARANDARANDARANDARANDARAEDRTDDLGDPEGADPAAARDIAAALHGPGRSDEGLGEHLPAEHPPVRLLLAAPDEDDGG